MRTNLWAVHKWHSGYTQYRVVDDDQPYPTCEHCLNIITKNGIETEDGDAVHLDCFIANTRADVEKTDICPVCGKPMVDGVGYKHGDEMLCYDCLVGCWGIRDDNLPDYKERYDEVDALDEYDACDFRDDAEGY